MIDQNSVSTLYGVSDLDGITPVLIEIDPVTGAILVEITVVADHASTLSPAQAGKDGNSVSTLLCQTDNNSGNMVPAIDSLNSQLFVDVL